MLPNTTYLYLRQPPDGSAPREWSSDLFACCDDPSNCCITNFCSCITFGQIAEIVDRGETSCVFEALVFSVLSYVCCPCLYSYRYRTKLRTMYSLKKDPCADCLVHCCCISCALCQEYRELKYHGIDPSIGWTANVEHWDQSETNAPPAVYPGMTR